VDTPGPASNRPTDSKPKLSPRRRARRVRLAQYVIFVAVLVFIVLVANWHLIGTVFFRPDMIKTTVTRLVQLAPGTPPRLIPGLLLAFSNTLAYSLGAFIIGLLLGVALALMKLSSVGPYRWVATIYIEIFRGLPALVVLLIFNYLPLGFNGLTIPFGTYGTVWLALGIVYASYMSETIRAGIQAVPKGQVEAARTLGMTAGMATRRIVLPQAFRIITPPLTNDLIALIKDSSLIYIIGLSARAFDLTKYGRDITNTTANLTPLIVAGLCYLVITVPLGALVRRMEARNAAKGGAR